MPYVTNTNKGQEVHKCALPHIKSGLYSIKIPVGTIWECDTCHSYYRAIIPNYLDHKAWQKIHFWNFLWYAKIIKHELVQRREKSERSKSE